jgi:hypothetical protein
VRVKPLLATLLVVGALVGLGLGVYRWESRQNSSDCQICGRMIAKETAYQLDTTHGALKACCPACAMHYMIHNSEQVRQGWATDFNTGRVISATSAYFDEGGDTQYCTAHMPKVERGPEGVSARVYDRCLPTLVAFSTREAAESYRQQHGGQVFNYDQTLASVRNQ